MRSFLSGFEGIVKIIILINHIFIADNQCDIRSKRTLKFVLYNLMAMRAAKCVCELRPVLNVPNNSSDLLVEM
jgi:hypothetical protein